MKIEAGKYYRTRDGRKVGPVTYRDGYFIANLLHYNSAGECGYEGRHDPSHDSRDEHDLIAEWPSETLTPHQQRTAEMIKVMQAYVDGEEVEYYALEEQEWKPLNETYWSQYRDYRIAPSATPDELDWGVVGALWNYRARDKNGYVYLYEHEPVQSGDHWKVCEGEFARVDAIFSSYHRGTCDWKDSLVKRP